MQSLEADNRDLEERVLQQQGIEQADNMGLHRRSENPVDNEFQELLMK